MEIDYNSAIFNNLQQTPQVCFEEEEEDVLSLCNFTLHDADQDDPISSLPDHPDFPSSSSSPSSPDDDFAFSVDIQSEQTQSPALDRNNDVVLVFGKSIPCRKPVVNVPTTSFQERRFDDPFCLKSESFDILRGPRSQFSTRSNSVRLPETGNCRYGQSSGSARKHKVLIGLVKFPSRMELGDIKKRQDRRPPAPMFPVVENCQLAVASGSGSGGGKGHWGGLFRPLRFRSHLVGALAKTSFGCLPRV